MKELKRILNGKRHRDRSNADSLDWFVLIAGVLLLLLILIYAFSHFGSGDLYLGDGHPVYL